ncbi:MAG: diguanylate cyclase [Bacillota bacterium]
MSGPVMNFLGISELQQLVDSLYKITGISCIINDSDGLPMISSSIINKNDPDIIDIPIKLKDREVATIKLIKSNKCESAKEELDKETVAVYTQLAKVMISFREKHYKWLSAEKMLYETKQHMSNIIQFEKLIAGISRQFINSFAHQIDTEINNALQAMGEFTKTDRSYVFLVSDDQKTVDNTHEWCAQGITAEKENLQGIPIDAIPWWMGKLNSFENIHIPDVDKMPAEARTEQEILKAQSIKSVIVVPLTLKNQLIGFLGFDSVRCNKYWPNEHITLLKIAGEIFANVLERKKTEEILQKSETKFRSIVENANDIICSIDNSGLVTYISPNCKKMLGYEAEEIEGKSFRSFLHPDDIVKGISIFDKFNDENEQTFSFESRVKHGTGVWRWYRINTSSSKNQKADFICIARDITEQKNTEEELKYLSLHDYLTGLYNRAYFDNEIRRLEGSREYPITIVSIDVDDLKVINDTMGHHKGDKILKNCAAVLKSSLRKSDILARIGGDEFAAILPRTDKKAADSVIERIKFVLAEYNNEHPGLPLSLSLGIATCMGPEEALNDVLKRADDMMYKTKHSSTFTTKGLIVNALLATLSERDFIANGHAFRLQKLGVQLGKKLGLSASQLNNLSILCQVHDLGKVGMPDRILFKGAPLSEEEWKVMRQHPQKGYRIAMSCVSLTSVAEFILKHHERWDGKGYPLGLKGEAIPLECRILAIIDAYDAMTNERPYRKAKSKEQAVEELRRCSGTQFDPVLVELFLQMLEEI